MMGTSDQSINLLPELSSPDWQMWSPRPDIAPRFDRRRDGEEVGLVIDSSGVFHAYGAWHCEVGGIADHCAWRIAVIYELSRIAHETVSINMIVTWKDESGKWLRREYIDEHVETTDPALDGSAEQSPPSVSVSPDGSAGLKSGCLGKTVNPPAGTAAVKVELEFRWAQGGTVCFRRASLSPASLTRRRTITAVTTYARLYGRDRTDLAANLQELTDILALAGQHRPDLVCFSETLYGGGAGRSVSEIAQPLDGELVRTIRDKTREIQSYVVFNFFERRGICIHNTSVLIDREGEIAGVYRKTHLPLAEAQDGVTPGND